MGHDRDAILLEAKNRVADAQASRSKSYNILRVEGQSAYEDYLVSEISRLTALVNSACETLEVVGPEKTKLLEHVLGALAGDP